MFNLPFNIFLMYLNGLAEDTSIMKIISLRQTPYSQIKDKATQELKAKFELKSKKQQTKKQVNNAIALFTTMLKNKEENEKKSTS